MNAPHHLSKLTARVLVPIAIGLMSPGAFADLAVAARAGLMPVESEVTTTPSGSPAAATTIRASATQPAFATPGDAKGAPSPSGFAIEGRAQDDARNVRVMFDAERIQPILTHVGEITHLEFPATDGPILRVMLGAREHWEIVAHPPSGANPARLFLKPNAEEVSTSATVVMTEGRVYELRLISVRAGGYRYQRVSFRVPEDEITAYRARDTATELPATRSPKAKTEAATLDLGQELNFEYDIKGDAAFRPAAVFDNKRFTYVALPPGLASLPVVFLTEQGQPQLVDYVPLVNSAGQVHRLQIQRLVEGLVLRLDGQEVQIQRRQPSVLARFWK
jgi:type IV secretion system protein TrbG